LRLLQHEFFVDATNLGGFFVSFTATGAVFFGSGERNVVLEVTDAGCIFLVDAQRVLVAL
jgi:hypothetical protein